MKANQKFRNDERAIANPLIGAVIGAVLVLAVGLSLTTTVVSFVNDSITVLGGNTAAQNLVEIIPIFYILGLVAASIGIVFVGMKMADG